ncbi:hypothetical protein [uncultured Flavobacterium sp.]|uniref:hypothetical protein n=1 Tax=uncultured Flavobacterium sp. TaxID=165435 RepID=UPI0025E3C4D6|nr:hypothetical protein [uncultured Flavobacterium sp.]
MKKILLGVAFFVTVTSALAQEITDKDLIGSWEIVALDLDGKGIYIDFEKDSISLTEEMVRDSTEEELVELKGYVSELLDLDRLKTLNLDFYEGHTMKAFLEDGTVLDHHAYLIVEDEGNYYVKYINSEEEILIDIRNELLYWIEQDHSDKTTTIFKRKES